MRCLIVDMLRALGLVQVSVVVGDPAQSWEGERFPDSVTS